MYFAVTLPSTCMGPLSPCDSDRVSGPSDSGSRSTSGDTGEGEHEVWFQSEGHIS